MNLKNLFLVGLLALIASVATHPGAADQRPQKAQAKLSVSAPEKVIEPRSTLVYFGAKWCGACVASKPGLEALEETAAVDVIHVDVDKPEDESYQKYQSYFEGRQLPYFALLDTDGNKTRGFGGQQTFESLLRSIQTKATSQRPG